MGKKKSKQGLLLHAKTYHGDSVIEKCLRSKEAKQLTPEVIGHFHKKVKPTLLNCLNTSDKTKKDLMKHCFIIILLIKNCANVTCVSPAAIRKLLNTSYNKTINFEVHLRNCGFTVKGFTQKPETKQKPKVKTTLSGDGEFKSEPPPSPSPSPKPTSRALGPASAPLGVPVKPKSDDRAIRVVRREMSGLGHNITIASLSTVTSEEETYIVTLEPRKVVKIMQKCKRVFRRVTYEQQNLLNCLAGFERLTEHKELWHLLLHESYVNFVSAFVREKYATFADKDPILFSAIFKAFYAHSIALFLADDKEMLKNQCIRILANLRGHPGMLSMDLPSVFYKEDISKDDCAKFVRDTYQSMTSSYSNLVVHVLGLYEIARTLYNDSDSDSDSQNMQALLNTALLNALTILHTVRGHLTALDLAKVKVLLAHFDRHKELLEEIYDWNLVNQLSMHTLGDVLFHAEKHTDSKPEVPEWGTSRPPLYCRNMFEDEPRKLPKGIASGSGRRAVNIRSSDWSVASAHAEPTGVAESKAGDTMSLVESAEEQKMNRLKVVATGGLIVESSLDPSANTFVFQPSMGQPQEPPTKPALQPPLPRTPPPPLPPTPPPPLPLTPPPPLPPTPPPPLPPTPPPPLPPGVRRVRSKDALALGGRASQQRRSDYSSAGLPPGTRRLSTDLVFSRRGLKQHLARLAKEREQSLYG